MLAQYLNPCFKKKKAVHLLYVLITLNSDDLGLHWAISALNFSWFLETFKQSKYTLQVQIIDMLQHRYKQLYN